MVSKFVVLGGGSAGLLSALFFKRRFPMASVQVIFSSEIGTIGVGESTTPNLPTFLFDKLEIPMRQFYELVEPTWKLGIKFLWGPRNHFNYSFRPQMDVRFPELKMANGYYCDQGVGENGMPAFNIESALMDNNRMFLRVNHQGQQGPQFLPGYAFHLENRKFVGGLEAVAKDRGIELIDGKLKGAERGPKGISAIVLEDGRRFDADIFIDCSGFKSELLGKALAEPFIGFQDSLFADRSIVGGWEIGADDEQHPYTTAETMDGGWAWRIDHRTMINRGYVYSSRFMSDDQAREEFTRKNPKIKLVDRVIKFQSGRYRRSWVDNVIAIGNACGFAEPLEATALMLVCFQLDTIGSLLADVGTGEKTHELYNRVVGSSWDETRDFISLHYKFNTRLDTPYWKHCRAETCIGTLKDFVTLYRETGPTGFTRYNMPNPTPQFGAEGPLVMMLGQNVPFDRRYAATDAERSAVRQRSAMFQAQARASYTVKESLDCIEHPMWSWASDPKPTNRVA